MRKYILSILLASVISGDLFAQSNDVSTPQKATAFPTNLDFSNKYNNAVLTPFYHHSLNKDTSGPSQKPLYFIKIQGDNILFKTLPTLNLIGQEDITSMEVLKDKTTIDTYGEKAKNGVIIISLARGTEILQENKLLDKYNIDNRFRKLPLFVDSTLTQRSAEMVYVSTKIKSLTVANEKESGMKYISILTNNDMISH